MNSLDYDDNDFGDDDDDLDLDNIKLDGKYYNLSLILLISRRF